MQYTVIFFSAVKIEKYFQKNFDICLIFAQNIACGYPLEPPRRGGSNEYPQSMFWSIAQNIACGYPLEPPRRGGSNEYPQSMFWSKNKKNKYTPAYPSFAITVGHGVYFSWTCFLD